MATSPAAALASTFLTSIVGALDNGRTLGLSLCMRSLAGKVDIKLRRGGI